jgi:hypothetical protein
MRRPILRQRSFAEMVVVQEHSVSLRSRRCREVAHWAANFIMAAQASKQVAISGGNRNDIRPDLTSDGICLTSYAIKR